MDTSDQIIVLTKWGCQWIKFAWNTIVEDGPAIKFAKTAIAQLDASSEDPADYVDGYIYENKKTIINAATQKSTIVGVVERRKTVIQKGNRSKFSAAVAKLAYNKFGERKMTEANVLVTRRWIQKYLDEPLYKDLRTCDKNIAIDRAMFLSFVPTRDFQKMTIATGTSAWKNRINASNVFGKIFQLATVSGNTDLVNT